MSGTFLYPPNRTPPPAPFFPLPARIFEYGFWFCYYTERDSTLLSGLIVWGLWLSFFTPNLKITPSPCIFNEPLKEGGRWKEKKK